jgi:peptide/nickel transport system ATP-binding protein
MSLLQIDDLHISFVQYTTGLRRQRLDVVTGIDLAVEAGELVAVVGASGSGKSLLAHAVLGVLPSNARVGGRILYDGAPLDERRLQRVRAAEIGFIPQSVSHLDPVAVVSAQVRRSAELASVPEPAKAADSALSTSGLDEAAVGRYPHQLSGGMARRVLTAMGTVGVPRLVIADEPTPGLNAEFVGELLTDLRRRADDGAAVVLITHDLLGALTIADRVAVFYAGTTVETSPTSAFTGDGSQLTHPYTRALWRALPGHGFTPIPGAQPAPTDLPPGCLFAARCGERIHECTTARPPARHVGQSIVRCIRA